MSQLDPSPRRVLIVGSTPLEAAIALARTVPADGLLIWIEGDRAAAARATDAFAHEGLSDRANVMVGDPALFIRKVAGPFDRIVLFVDDDTAARIETHAERLLTPGGTVVRGGGSALG